jgi:predicted lactoylglutathione lyase
MTGMDKTERSAVISHSLTVLLKTRHYADFFKQEVSLDGRAERVRAIHGVPE